VGRVLISRSGSMMIPMHLLRSIAIRPNLTFKLFGPSFQFKLGRIAVLYLPLVIVLPEPPISLSAPPSSGLLIKSACFVDVI